MATLVQDARNPTAGHPALVNHRSSGRTVDRAIGRTTSPVVRMERRHRAAMTRRRRDDLWVGGTAMAAGLVALPLATNSWHGPEVAATLAVAATALLAGQRWAIGIIVLAELLLLPTIWPRAFLDHGPLPGQVAALIALGCVVPGVLALRRAAAALVLLLGRPRTQKTCRRFQTGLVVAAVISAVLPLI
jgi:hypothetical protein